MTPNSSSSASDHGDSRRRFVKKAAYMAPALMTLPAMLSAAQVGSGAGVCDVQQGVIVGGPFDGQECS